MNFGKGLRLNESSANLQEEPSIVLSEQPSPSGRDGGSGDRMTPALRLSGMRMADSFVVDEEELGRRRANEQVGAHRRNAQRRSKKKCIGLERRILIAIIVGLAIVSFLMIVSEIYFFIRMGLRMFDYQVQATRVEIQDPTINNYVSLVEVDRFFISDNQNPSYETVETGGRASYLIARMNETCSLVDTTKVELWETQNKAEDGLSLIKGSFPIFTICYTISYMIALWIAAFICGPKVQFHEIPPFLRRKTRTQNLHSITALLFIAQLLLAGCLMPLHFINLSQSCVLTTTHRLSAKDSLAQYFAMQVLLLFVSLPILLMVLCRKISAAVTILFQVLIFVSMLFFLYLLVASYFFLWYVAIQDYVFFQSFLYLIVVLIPVLYVFVAIMKIIIATIVRCHRARRRSNKKN